MRNATLVRRMASCLSARRDLKIFGSSATKPSRTSSSSTVIGIFCLGSALRAEVNPNHSEGMATSPMRHDTSAETHRVPGLVVVHRAPEWTVHVGEVPVPVLRPVAGLVQDDTGLARRYPQRRELFADAGERALVGADVAAAAVVGEWNDGWN